MVFKLYQIVVSVIILFPESIFFGKFPLFSVVLHRIRTALNLALHDLSMLTVSTKLSLSSLILLPPDGFPPIVQRGIGPPFPSLPFLLFITCTIFHPICRLISAHKERERISKVYCQPLKRVSKHTTILSQFSVKYWVEWEESLPNSNNSSHRGGWHCDWRMMELRSGQRSEWNRRYLRKIKDQLERSKINSNLDCVLPVDILSVLWFVRRRRTRGRIRGRRRITHSEGVR